MAFPYVLAHQQQQQQHGSYDHTYPKHQQKNSSDHPYNVTHQRPINYDHTYPRHQLNQSQGSLAGIRQPLPSACNPTHTRVIPQRNFTAAYVRMVPEMPCTSATYDSRPAAIYTGRAHISTAASQPVFPTPQNVTLTHGTSSSKAPVHLAKTVAGNTVPVSQPSGVQQSHTGSQQSTHSQNTSYPPFLVQMVRPQFRFDHRMQLPRNVQLPVQHMSNGSAPAQQAPRQQMRPSSFIVIRPQRPAVQTSGAITSQATPRHPAARPQTGMQMQTRAPNPAVSTSVVTTSQSRPQYHMTSASAGIQSQVRAQCLIAPPPVSIPSQTRPMMTAVRHSVRPDVPSGGTIAVRQAAPTSLPSQQSSTSNFATINSMPSAQKRSLVLESGIQLAPTRPKLPRVPAQSKTGDCELSITLRTAYPTVPTTNVTIDPVNKSGPDQVNTVASLMNNPHITLVPAKNKENTSNSDAVGKQAGSRQEPALVDLTADGNPPPKESAWKNSLTCQVCNQT